MKEKLRRNFWLPSEIEMMLKLIKNMQTTRGSTSTTHHTFVQIANKMRKLGFPNKTALQIRRKWFQMKSAYLCYKRGNVERLMLIPERFRNVIAQFVEAESKYSGRIVTSSPTSVEETKPNIKRPQITPIPITTEKEFATPSFYEQELARFLTRNQQIQKIMGEDCAHMEKVLLDYQKDCHAVRHANLRAFFKDIK